MQRILKVEVKTLELQKDERGYTRECNDHVVYSRTIAIDREHDDFEVLAAQVLTALLLEREVKTENTNDTQTSK